MTPSDQLEDLIRSTLHSRAGTVTTGVPWAVPAAPAGPRRRRWVPAVAAAAVVLGIAAAGLGYRASRPDDGPSVTGDGNVACRVPLPAGWDAARATQPLRIGDDPAHIVDVAPGGTTLLQRDGRGGDVVVAAVGADGTPLRRVDLGPARLTSQASTDGTSVVAAQRSDDFGAVTRLVLVDIATGRRTDPLAHAPAVPRGWVAGAETTVRDGVVYWTVSPPDPDARGRVMAYDVTTGTYRVVARPTGGADLVSDARGVQWHGGSVPAKDVPAQVPAETEDVGVTARFVSDGSMFAWQRSRDQGPIHWASTDGRSGSFRLDAKGGPDTVAVAAAAGPFVFVFLDQARDNRFVYDTRSGALAAYDDRSLYESEPHGTLTELRNLQRYYRVDVARLPELAC